MNKHHDEGENYEPKIQSEDEMEVWDEEARENCEPEKKITTICTSRPEWKKRGVAPGEEFEHRSFGYDGEIRTGELADGIHRLWRFLENEFGSPKGLAILREASQTANVFEFHKGKQRISAMHGFLRENYDGSTSETLTLALAWHLDNVWKDDPETETEKANG